MTKTTPEEAAALARQYAATFADKYEFNGGTVPAEFTFTEAQLAAQPPAVAVPEGMALVPIEPTPEMIAAAVATGSRNSKAGYWAAMLAAAPQPPAGQQSGGDGIGSPLTIYLDGDAIDVEQFYRAKGFEKLPPTPTMSGAEIRACGWKKNDYPMYIDGGNGVPFTAIGDSAAAPLVNGMRFCCVPPAYATPDLIAPSPATPGNGETEK